MTVGNLSGCIMLKLMKFSYIFQEKKNTLLKQLFVQNALNSGLGRGFRGACTCCKFTYHFTNMISKLIRVLIHCKLQVAAQSS